MYSLIILLLVSYVQTQQDTCSCSCCVGQFCSPTNVGNFSLQSCTLETCRTYCRIYSQCQTDYPYGQVLPQCLSSLTTMSPSYNCRCDCCRTGSPSCTPFFVGYSTAYSCQPGSCSISCAAQYPGQCASDQYGQTVGTCIGAITTTTTTTVSTTSGYWLGNTCSCRCCQSGPNCTPYITVGNAIVTQCSSTTCITACQTQYPSSCPSNSNFGQTNGVCTNQTSVNTRCQCQCCGLNGCPTYYVNTNEGCASCSTLCQQQCGYTNPTTYTCGSNRSNKSIQVSVPLIIFITIIILPIYSIF